MSTKMDYPEYFAQFYDIIYDSIRSHVDTDFYLDRIKQSKGPVLEIGCGTGRFFSKAIKQGVDIYGIDISESMVKFLLKKIERNQYERISLQSAVDFNFPFKFDLIIAPFRVYSHLLTVDEQLAALNNAYDHLSDNGRLIFDLYVPDPAMIASGLNNIVDFDGEYMPGKKMSRIVTMKADVVNQISDITMTFKWDEHDRQRTESWNFKFRFYFRYELEHLVARSKLAIEKIYGDFKGGNLTADSREFIVVCRK
jgi:SAM-dependent methyltransferase